MKKRIVARIDVKNHYVIKGIQLEGLRRIGDPNDLAKKYYEMGIDEIVFMDVVASLYERNSLLNVIAQACENVFVPIVVGGGIRSNDDIYKALKAGADKIAVNTQAIKTPSIIKVAAETFGSQCVVVSIEAKRRPWGWEAYMNNGREETGKDVLQWVDEVQRLGAGEILLTSIDREGTQQGFEIDLVSEVSRRANIPLIVSGGAGSLNHIAQLFEECRVDAVALASVFHYNKHSIQEVKQALADKGIEVRR